VAAELAGPVVPVAAGPVVPVAAELVVPVAAEPAGPVVPVAAEPAAPVVALPVVPAGRVERVALGEQAAARGLAPLVVVRPGGAPVAAGRLPEEAVARGQPVAAPRPEPGRVRGLPELEVPGLDPGHPAVAEVWEVLEPHPPREVRVALMVSPCLSSSGPILLLARSARRSLVRNPCCAPRCQLGCGRLRSY
jgi:hypothetical protein